MDSIIEKNIWHDLNSSANTITEKTEKCINLSIKNNNILANFNFNKNNYLNFLCILADDITRRTNMKSICNLLSYIGNTKQIKKNSDTSNLMLTYHNTQLYLRKDIYDKILEFYAIASKDKTFGYDQTKFIKMVIKKYKNSGVELNNNRKKILSDIKYEIDRIENFLIQYMCYEDTKLLGFTRKELYGLPINYINNMPIVSQTPKKYGVQLDENTYTRCMRFIHNSNVRKTIDTVYSSKCGKYIDNILKLFVLRHKHAQLLSYKNHSDYTVNGQMAMNSNHINNFLKIVASKLDYRYYREIKSLHNIAKKSEKYDGKLYKWDIPYYVTKWKTIYGINDEMLQEYFPLKHVIMNLFKLFETMFNLKFIKIRNPYVWHSDVELYAVRDLSTSLLIGHFYMDLYNRNGKNNQIKCFYLRSPCIYPFKYNTIQLPSIALIASFTNKDALLYYSEVASLMYKFGFILQHVCGRSKYVLFSGMNTEKDFIKVIPQIIGYLCWDKNILKILSSHYVTKKPISSDMIDKIIRIKNLNIGLHYKHQILIGLYDQLVHSNIHFLKKCDSILRKTNCTNEIINILIFSYKRLYERIMSYGDDNKYSIQFNEGTFMPVSWIRFLCGYDGLYYNNIWSRIVSSDIYFNKFLKKKSLKMAARKLKENILDKYGTVNANVLIKNYLNRAPDISGFLRLFKLESDAEFSFYLNSEHFTITHAQEDDDTDEKPNYRFDHNIIRSDTVDDVSVSQSNKFCEIDGTDRSTNFIFLKNKFQNIDNDNDICITENTETMDKYKSLFIKK